MFFGGIGSGHKIDIHTKFSRDCYIEWFHVHIISSHIVFVHPYMEKMLQHSLCFCYIKTYNGQRISQLIVFIYPQKVHVVLIKSCRFVLEVSFLNAKQFIAIQLVNSVNKFRAEKSGRNQLSNPISGVLTTSFGNLSFCCTEGKICCVDVTEKLTWHWQL